jgi:tetratricopeptide (TPR) repeat protein
MREMVYYREKRYDEALAAYDHAIELDPHYADAYYNKGEVLRRFERYDDALVLYNLAVEADPLFADAWYKKGRMLHKLKRDKEALVAYDQAIQLEPLMPGFITAMLMSYLNWDATKKPW